MERYTLITSAEALRDAAERWAARPALAVDTEFVRTRTFYPKLGLIQVATDDAQALIDPLAITELEPLGELLADPAVTKVFHSCGEDLEVLYHRFGRFPRPLFDTQVAAALTGHGYSLGYARLVEELIGAELPKGQTRTDWLRRPLSEAQKRYAALDVAHLPALHRRLAAGLEAAGRSTWLEEEVERLAEVERFLPDPETLFRRLKGIGGLSSRQLAVLRELCAWREREARRRDLPRNHVIHESALRQIAQRTPRSTKALARLPAVGPRELRRHGEALLEAVERALSLDPEECPPKAERGVDLSRHRRQLTQLKRTLEAIAGELGLPSELLATRRTLEELLRRALAGSQPPLPPELEGWRRTVVGEPLAASIA